MTNGKQLYLVVGSEDGPIGIFSSHAKALVVAIRYAGAFADEDSQEMKPVVTSTEYVTTVAGLNFVEIRKDFELNAAYF